MQKRYRVFSLALSIALTLSMLPTMIFGAAEGPQLSVGYTFSGEESDLPGYAEGTVSITSRSANQGYYILYWANDAGILPGYEKIAAVSIEKDASTTVYEMVENMVIPEGATKLAVFTASGTEPASKELAQAAVYEIPAQKRFESGRLEMSFASVSDVHVNYNSSDPNSDNYCGAPEKWTAALNYFAELGLEMVVISGDCTSVGSVS